MKILVTGASGLLGGCLANELSGKHQVTGAGHGNQARGGMFTITLDAANGKAVRDAVDGKGFETIVHCAALRSPEECAEDVERAYRVNVVSVENIAEAANRNGAKIVYISTDYVFPGTDAPYREDSPFQPLNLYGRTKLAGEFAARSASRHLVARIPALYGDDPEDPKGNQKEFLEKFRSGAPFPVENRLVRHFALARDYNAPRN